MEDGEREGTRSFVKPLPASFPPAGQMTTQLTHSFMTATAATMAMKVEVLRRANTQQKARHAVHSKMHSGGRKVLGQKSREKDPEDSKKLDCREENNHLHVLLA